MVALIVRKGTGRLTVPSVSNKKARGICTHLWGTRLVFSCFLNTTSYMLAKRSLTTPTFACSLRKHSAPSLWKEKQPSQTPERKQMSMPPVSFTFESRNQSWQCITFITLLANCMAHHLLALSAFGRLADSSSCFSEVLLFSQLTLEKAEVESAFWLTVLWCPILDGSHSP